MGIYSKMVGGKMEMKLDGFIMQCFLLAVCGFGIFGLVVLKTVGLFSLSSLKTIRLLEIR